MNKKTLLLLGLTAATSIATMFGVILAAREDNHGAFAQEIEPGRFVAVINSENRVKETNLPGKYGFQLHGGEEYGYLYSPVDGRLDNNPTGEYSDYALAWHNTDGQPYYFEIRLDNLGDSVIAEIDGKVRTLRGFPGIKRITTIYKNPSGIRVDSCRPDSKWDITSETDENTGLITETATAPETMYYFHMAWCTREVGTIYIKSITLEYTCS